MEIKLDCKRKPLATQKLDRRPLKIRYENRLSALTPQVPETDPVQQTTTQEGEPHGLDIPNWLHASKKIEISLEDDNRTLTLMIFKIFRI